MSNKRYNVQDLNKDIKKVLIKKMQYSKDKILRMRITKIMKELGMSPSLKGYHYIGDAIFMIIKNQEKILQIGKLIYTQIANEYETNICAVERSIRTAIEIVIKNGNIEVIQKIFGYTINPDKGKPTNKEFIVTIAEKIKLEMDIVVKKYPRKA